MTDEELIRLLRLGEWGGAGDEEMVIAADRIEQLAIETNETHEEAMECLTMWGDALKGQRAAEAKLAKAGIVALETILNERGPVFDAMVEAAEDAALKDVSFNVVVWRSILAGLDELEKSE